MTEKYIYLARKTVIEMLDDRGYDVSQIVKNYPYSQFKNMLNYFDNYSGILDINIKDKNKSIYVKFVNQVNDNNDKYAGITQKNIRSVNKELSELKEFIDINFSPDEIMFVICYGNEYHEKHKIEEEKYNNVQIFHINNLVFNISKHKLVPKHIKMSQTELDILLSKLMLESIYQLPFINPRDPMARYLNLKEGDVCKIIRNSTDAFIHICYRVCSNEDNDRNIKQLRKLRDFVKKNVSINSEILTNDENIYKLQDTKSTIETKDIVQECQQKITYTPNFEFENVSTDIPYVLGKDTLNFSIGGHLMEFSPFNILDNDNQTFRGTVIENYIESTMEDYGNWNLNSKLNTMEYMFDKFRSGYFLQIRDGKLNDFIPFYNVMFENDWHKLVTPNNSIKGINPDHKQWMATNCLLKLTYRPRTDLYNLDTFMEVKNMFEKLCENRGESLQDIDLFINVKDFPLLRKDKTEPYNHIYGKNRPLSDKWRDLSYYPILSYNSNSDFLDIPIPTNHEWQAITQEIFPSKCQKQYINDFTPKKWEEKIPIAVFRGSATGCSININNNPRLKVALLDKAWSNKNHPNHGLLDAGVTKFPNHLVTEEGNPNVYNTRDPELPNMEINEYDGIKFKDLISCGSWDKTGRAQYISMQEQSKYKYILNIEGNSAAYRLSYLLSLGSVILNVKSENKLWWEKLWKPYNFSRSPEKTKPEDIGEYIEVDRDLFHLEDIIRWCKDNDETCKIIAENAKRFYNKYLTRNGVYDYLENIINNIANNEISQVYKTNIIVPFRDTPDESKTSDKQNRSLHLEQFLNHMDTFIPKLTNYLKETKGIDSQFDITIVEQSQDGQLFNRGALLNAAYTLTIDNGEPEYNSYIFHDVDLLPNDNMISAYSGPYQKDDIVHIASEWARYKNPGKYLGGVTLFGHYVFGAINGFPNNYWGWGGEDDELRRRKEKVSKMPLNTLNPIQLVGKEDGLIDLEDISTAKDKQRVLKSQGNINPVRYEGKDRHDETWKENGVRQLLDSDVEMFEMINESNEVKSYGDYTYNIKRLTLRLDYEQMRPFEINPELSKR